MPRAKKQIPPEYIQCAGFTVRIVRSKARKKTVSLQVKQCEIALLVPTRTTQDKIEALLKAKADWLKAKIFQQKDALEPVSERRFVHDESLPFLGGFYLLDLQAAKTLPVELKEGRLLVRTPNTNNKTKIRKMLVDWYKIQAEIIFTRRVNYYAPLLRVKPKDIEIKTYRARWGSCTAKGVVQFNWKLMLAPEPIVDYVVIHELCHLIEFNHSPLFWAQVARLDPEYKTHRDWLTRFGSQLTL